MYIDKPVVFIKKKKKKPVEMEKPFLFEQEQLEKIFCFYK